MQAMITIGCELGFINEPTMRQLLREAGESEPKEFEWSLGHPVWDPGAGELRFNGEVIREVRLTKIPTSIQQILDAFQKSDWPDEIKSPFPDDDQNKKPSEVIRSLNDGLVENCKVKFHVRKQGSAFHWALVTK